MKAISGVKVLPRDIEILRALYDSRFLTLRHVGELFFPSESAERAYQTAQQRVYKLKKGGLVAGQPKRNHPMDPERVSLTRTGFEYLTSQRLIEDYPQMRWESLRERIDIRPYTVDHETAILDIRCAITTAAKARGLTILEYSTWPQLFLFNLPEHPRPEGENLHKKGYQLEADSFLRIAGEHNEPVAYFFELDRGTELRPSVVDKALAYRLLQSKYQNLLGPRAGARQGSAVAIAALFVFQSRTGSATGSKEMRNNFLERVAKETTIKTLVYAGTFDDVRRDPLGTVWLRPKEYREALQGTGYHPAHLPEIFKQVRRPEREELLDKRTELVSPFGYKPSAPLHGS